MPTFLFDKTIFGPIKSRRFGVSLGVNLLPNDYKYCNFNCVYCECGWTYEADKEKIKLPTPEEVNKQLEEKLADMISKGEPLDNITFAGNGEPTIHPQFPDIVDDSIKLRDKYYPQAKITVLSNATQLNKRNTITALQKVDHNVLKLDAGTNEQFHLINQPKNKIDIDRVVDFLQTFKGNLIIQSLFLKGEVDGKIIDNISTEELEVWLQQLQKIMPKSVMIYSIARDTPAEKLEIITKSQLEEIAKKVKEIGIEAEVY